MRGDKINFQVSYCRRNLDGHSGICKTCRNKYYLERYARDKDTIKALNKKYREDHKESYQEYSRRYREEHKELFKDLARKRLWRVKNEEGIREYNKKYKLKHKIASL